MSPQQSTPVAERLRTLAEWLDQHPLASGSLSAIGGAWVIYHSVDRADSAIQELTDVRRHIGGRWTKSDDPILGFVLTREVLPGVTYKLYAARENVCQRIVVAREEIEVEEADPAALAALPKVKRTTVREKVEWRCPGALLAEDSVVDPQVADDIATLSRAALTPAPDGGVAA